MKSVDLKLNVLTTEQAKARFAKLDPCLARQHNLSAYFDNDLVVFVDPGEDDLNAAEIMSRAEFTHVSFSAWPGCDNHIDSFERLMVYYFHNAFIMETEREVRVAAIAKNLY